MRHHVHDAGGPLAPRDVVPVDEGIRACGEGGTTSMTPTTRSARRRLHSDTLLSNHRFFTQKTALYGKMLRYITGWRQPCPAPGGLSVPRRAFSSPKGSLAPVGPSVPRRVHWPPEGFTGPPEGHQFPGGVTTCPAGSKKARPQPKKRGTHLCS